MDDVISREEALDCFHDWMDKQGCVHTPDEMAEYREIEELPSAQPEPCEDAVGRDAVVRFLDDWISALDANCHHQSMADLKIVKNDFKNLPSAQQMRWIPCSERMPEELEEVNVTWVNHKPEPYYDFVKDKPFTASAVYYKGDWYWYSSVCTDLLAERGENEIDKIDDAIEITAWMPLPGPWKGDTE